MDSLKTPDRISLLELLYTCNDELKSDICKIRKKFKLAAKPKGLFDIDRFLQFDKQILLFSKIAVAYKNEVERVAEKYGLLDYMEDLEIFIETGRTPYDEDNLSYVLTFISKIGSPRMLDFQNKVGAKKPGFWVEFQIRKPINKSDLKKWINKHADQIATEANESLSGRKTSVIRLDNAQRILEVIKLRNKKSKQGKHRFTFSQIADRICEKYPEDPDVINGKVNEVSVRQIYNRYKKKYL